MGTGEPMGPSVAYLARIIDAVTYGAVVAVAWSLVCAVLGLLVFGSWSGVKLLLFIAGFLQIAIGVAQLWPTDISDVERPHERTPDDVSGVQAVVNRVAPFEQLGLPPDERFEPGVRQFVAGLLLLGVSYSMEAVFGIPG